MKSLYTEIIIDLPPDKVWEVLMDFEKYGQWNPFVVEISGPAVEGEKLKIKLQQPEGSSFGFKPKCIKMTENEEFKWAGNFIIPGLFDGEHCFKLKPFEKGKTKFIQREDFKGLLLSMMWKDISTKTLKGFEMMNTAIKKRSEELAGLS